MEEATVKHELTYRLPESVVGGARRSGFCCSKGMLEGPRIVAPSDSLIGTGSPESRLQRGELGSVLANGTVAVASTAEEVPDGAGMEDGAADATEDALKLLTAGAEAAGAA